MDFKDTIKNFLIVVLIFSIIFWGLLGIASCPARFFINKIHKKEEEEINTYYFYYQKATAYRLLFSFHTIFDYTLKIVGSAMTFITIYCAIDENQEYIVLFSMIAAISQVIALTIPTQKYAKVFVEAARMLEYELNKEYNDFKEKKENLNGVYKKAEELISKEYL